MQIESNTNNQGGQRSTHQLSFPGEHHKNSERPSATATNTMRTVRFYVIFFYYDRSIPKSYVCECYLRRVWDVLILENPRSTRNGHNNFVSLGERDLGFIHMVNFILRPIRRVDEACFLYESREG